MTEAIRRSGPALLVFLFAVTALAGCGESTTTQEDVAAIQQEMKNQTPKDAQAVDPSKATAGLKTAGPGKGGK